MIEHFTQESASIKKKRQKKKEKQTIFDKINFNSFTTTIYKYMVAYFCHEIWDSFHDNFWELSQ